MSDENIIPNPETDDSTAYPLRRSSRLNSVSTPKSISKRRRSSAIEDAENTPVRRSLRLNQNRIATPESTKATRIITRRASANEVQTSKRQQTRETNDSEGNKKQQISRRCVSESPTGKRHISSSEGEEDSTTFRILRRSVRRSLTHSPSSNKQSHEHKLTAVSEDPSEDSETNTVDNATEKKTEKSINFQVTSSGKEKKYDKENSDYENVEKPEFSEEIENKTVEISPPKKRNLTRYRKSVNVVEEKEKSAESHSPISSERTRKNTLSVKPNVDDRFDEESRDTKSDISQNKISEDVSQFKDISSSTTHDNMIANTLFESPSSNEKLGHKTITSILIEKAEVSNDSLSDVNRKEKFVLVETESFQSKITKQDDTYSDDKKASIFEEVGSHEKSVEDANRKMSADIDIKVDEYKTAVNIKEYADNYDVPIKDSPSVRHSLEGLKTCDSSNNEFENIEEHADNYNVPKKDSPSVRHSLEGSKTCDTSNNEFENIKEHADNYDVPVKDSPSVRHSLEGSKTCDSSNNEFQNNKNKKPLSYECFALDNFFEDSISSSEISLRIDENKEISEEKIPSGSSDIDIAVENAAPKEVRNTYENEDSQIFDPLQMNTVRKLDTKKEATGSSIPGKKFEDLNSEERINNDMECCVSINSDEEVSSSSPNASSKMSPFKEENSKPSETPTKTETCCPKDSNESFEESISNGMLTPENENCNRINSAGKEYLDVSKTSFHNENTGNSFKDLDKVVQDTARNSTNCHMSRNGCDKNRDNSLDSLAGSPDNQHVEKCDILSNKATEAVQNGMDSNVNSSLEKNEHFESEKTSNPDEKDFSTQHSHKDTSETFVHKSNKPLANKSQVDDPEENQNNENISLEISTNANEMKLEMKEEDFFEDEINDSYEGISESVQECDVSSDSFVEESSNDGANEFEHPSSKSENSLKKLQSDGLGKNDCTESSRIKRGENTIAYSQQFDKVQSIPAIENSQTLFSIQTFSIDSTDKRENSEQDEVKSYTESTETERVENISTKYDFHNILQESSTNTVHLSHTGKENHTSCLSEGNINNSVEKDNDIGKCNDLSYKNKIQDNELNIIEQKDSIKMFENQTSKESNTNEQFENSKKDNDIPFRRETDSVSENDESWENQRKKNVSTEKALIGTLENQNLEDCIEDQLTEEHTYIQEVEDSNKTTACNKSLNISKEIIVTSGNNENEKNSPRICTIRKKNISKPKLSENLISGSDSKDEKFIAIDIQKSKAPNYHLEDGELLGNSKEISFTLKNDKNTKNLLDRPTKKKVSKQNTPIGKAQLEQNNVSERCMNDVKKLDNIHKSEDISEFKENESPCNIEKSGLVSKNDEYDMCSTPRSTYKKKNSKCKTTELPDQLLEKTYVEQLAELDVDHKNINDNEESDLFLGNDSSIKKDRKKKRKRSNGTTQENKILKEKGAVEECDDDKEEKGVNQYSKHETLENKGADTFENDIEKKSSTPKSTDKKESILKQKISVSLWTPGKENNVNEQFQNNPKRRKLTLPKEVEEKITEQITQFLNESKESDSSRSLFETADETEGFLDDMAEEGEESTPSEDSNEIPDRGESVGYSSSEEYEDDSYEKNSFIDDEEYELLSGSEYNIDSDVDSPGHKRGNKNGQCMSKKKWSRIITVEDSSKEDTSEGEIIDVDKETDTKDENPEMSLPGLYVSDGEKSKIVIAASTSGCRKSSIIVKENISVEDIKDVSLRERINKFVESFCTNNYPKGDLTLNVSLDYSPKTEADSPPKLKSAADKATVSKIKIASRENSSKLVPETHGTITMMPSNLGKKSSESNDSSKTPSESNYILDERSKSKRKKKKINSKVDSFESIIQETVDEKSETIREVNNKEKKPSAEQTHCINIGKDLNVKDSRYHEEKYETDFKTTAANKNHEIKLSGEVIKSKKFRSKPPLENLSVPKKLKQRKHDRKVDNTKSELTKEIAFSRNIETEGEQRVIKQAKSKQKKHNLGKDVSMKIAERKSLLNKFFPANSEVNSTSERQSHKKRKIRTHLSKSPKQAHSIEIEDPDMPKRKKRKILASLNSATDMWNVESVVIKPSHRSNKAVVISSSSPAFDPKDIRNRVMFDKRRVRRV